MIYIYIYIYASTRLTANGIINPVMIMVNMFTKVGVEEMVTGSSDPVGGGVNPSRWTRLLFAVT